MSNDRNMNLIITLRNNKQNMKEVTRLTGELEKLHKNVQKIGNGFSGQKNTKTLMRDLEKLKKEVSNTAGSFKNLGQGGEEDLSKLQNKIVSLSKILNTLIDGTQKTKGKFKEFSDESSDDLLGMQATLDGLVAVLDRAGFGVEKLNAKEKILVNSIKESIAAFQAKTATVQKTISVFTQLETSLRKIQVLGDFKGTSLFKQEVASVRVFRKELEELRLKLANVTGEGLKVGGRVISEKALADLRKMGVAFDKTKDDVKELTMVLNELRKFQSITDNFKTTKSREEFAKLKLVIAGAFERFGVQINQSVKGFKNFDKEIAKGMAQVKQSFADAGISAEKLEQLYQESFNSMAKSTNAFIRANSKIKTAGKDYVRVLERIEQITGKAISKLEALKSAQITLQATSDLVARKLTTEAQAQEAANKVHSLADDILRNEGAALHGTARAAKDFATALRQAVDPMKTLTISTKIYDKEMTRLAADLKRLTSVSNITGRTQKIMEKELRILEKIAQATDRELNKLVLTMERLGKDTKPKVIAAYKAQLKKLGIEAGATSEKMKLLKREINHLNNVFGDQERAMHRVSADGFANMMVSQAAWMIGFTAIFGTLKAFKGALNSIVETQLAVARAMRTIRDENKSTAEMQDFLTAAIDRTRMRLGATAEDVGEVLYQLGSAGLHLSEALAALDSTMDNVIGTEADMENITNMVAGVYNNFKEQIIKVNGEVTTVSNTFKALSTDVVEAATQVEKFKLINDLLVRTFDAHQAEMDQIRDGLKFMTQSAKAVNVTLTQQLGILATLHDHLIKAGAAGRGMRVIFSKIAKDSKQWEEAFNIKIDQEKPLNFMKILEDISIQMTKGAWKAKELGNIFSRLGLRGNEPFMVLIKYIKELKGNFVDLEKNAKNAASAMAEIRLDNLGDQARKAGIAVEVLIKNGLEPLSTMMTTVIAGFNVVADVVKVVNTALGGLLAKIIVFTTWALLVAGLSFAMKNLRGVINWVWVVLMKLVVLMKRFGTETLVAGTNVTTLSTRMKTLGASFATARAGATGLKGTLIGVRTVLSSFIVPALIIALSQLIMYMAQWKQRTEDELKVLKAQEKTLIQNRDAIDSLIEKMSDSTEKGEDWNQILAETAKMLGINIDEYKYLGIEADIVKEKLEKLRKEHEKLVQAQRAERLLKELVLMKDRISDLRIEVQNLNSEKLFGGDFFLDVNTHKVTLTEARKLWLDSKDALRELNVELVNTNKALSESKAVDVQKQYGQLKDEILKLIKTQKDRTKVLEKEYNVLNKTVDAQNREADILKKGTATRAIALKYAKEITIINNKLSISVGDLAKNEELLTSEIWNVTDEHRKLVKEINTLEKRYKAAKLKNEKYIASFVEIKEALGDSNESFNDFVKKIEQVNKKVSSGSGAIGDLQLQLFNFKTALSEITRGKEIDVFLSKTQSMWIQLESVRNAADPTMFDKFLKSILSLGKGGEIIFKKLNKDVEKLSKYLLNLEKIKIKIKLDGFRRELDSSTDKVNILKQHIDLLKTQGKKGSWEMEKATRQYSRAMKEAILILKEQVKEHESLAKAAEARAEAAANAANADGISETKRLEALKQQEKSLREAIASYDTMKAAIKDRYAKEREKIFETAKNKTKLSNEELRKIEKVKNDQIKALENVDKEIKKVQKTRTELQDTLAISAKTEIDDIKNLINVIAASMTDLQRISKEGLKLNYQSIKDAIKEADKLHKNLERKATKKVKIVLIPEGGSSNKKYLGGAIRRASGGMVRAMVTDGEGYVPPEKVRGNIETLNKLNSGKITDLVPSDITMFSGKKGIDQIETYLPEGSYVISKKGMDAYGDSVKEGAEMFRFGGEVHKYNSGSDGGVGSSNSNSSKGKDSFNFDINFTPIFKNIIVPNELFEKVGKVTSEKLGKFLNPKINDIMVESNVIQEAGREAGDKFGDSMIVAIGGVGIKETIAKEFGSAKITDSFKRPIIEVKKMFDDLIPKEITTKIDIDIDTEKMNQYYKLITQPKSVEIKAEIDNTSFEQARTTIKDLPKPAPIEFDVIITDKEKILGLQEQLNGLNKTIDKLKETNIKIGIDDNDELNKLNKKAINLRAQLIRLGGPTKVKVEADVDFEDFFPLLSLMDELSKKHTFQVGADVDPVLEKLQKDIPEVIKKVSKPAMLTFGVNKTSYSAAMKIINSKKTELEKDEWRIKMGLNNPSQKRLERELKQFQIDNAGIIEYKAEGHVEDAAWKFESFKENAERDIVVKLHGDAHDAMYKVFELRKAIEDKKVTTHIDAVTSSAEQAYYKFLGKLDANQPELSLKIMKQRADLEVEEFVSKHKGENVPMALAIELDRARKSLKNWEEEVHKKEAVKLQIDAEVEKAQLKVNVWRERLDEDPANVKIRAILDHAEKELNKWKEKQAAPESAMELSAKLRMEQAREVVNEYEKELAKYPINLPIDVTPREVATVKDDLEKTLEKKPPEIPVEGNFDPALEGFQRLGREIEQTETKMPIDGNTDPAEKEFRKIIDEIKNTTATFTIVAKKKLSSDDLGKYYGGEIKRYYGGMIPARVSNGEGYIPPEMVTNHRSALTTLNSGHIPSEIPRIMQQFSGPGGVDNISTQLPTGSYVISKRGMDAYERASNQGVKTFREGGEVDSIPVPLSSSSENEFESMGSFTIVVSKEGKEKEFPIMGKASVLSDLRKELEQDRLTRLH